MTLGIGGNTAQAMRNCITWHAIDPILVLNHTKKPTPTRRGSKGERAPHSSKRLKKIRKALSRVSLHEVQSRNEFETLCFSSLIREYAAILDTICSANKANNSILTVHFLGQCCHACAVQTRCFDVTRRRCLFGWRVFRFTHHTHRAAEAVVFWMRFVVFTRHHTNAGPNHTVLTGECRQVLLSDLFLA